MMVVAVAFAAAAFAFAAAVVTFHATQHNYERDEAYNLLFYHCICRVYQFSVFFPVKLFSNLFL